MCAELAGLPCWLRAAVAEAAEPPLLDGDAALRVAGGAPQLPVESVRQPQLHLVLSHCSLLLGGFLGLVGRTFVAVGGQLRWLGLIDWSLTKKASMMSCNSILRGIQSVRQCLYVRWRFWMGLISVRETDWLK